MNKPLLLLATLSTLPALAASHPYATAQCEENCQTYSYHSTIVQATTPQNYRICTADSFSIEIVIDGRSQTLIPPANSARVCADVQGKEIRIRSGTALAGRNPA
ncbi:hypothetical protein [Chitinimonas lacunae]|uniref:DUF2845 domain-containing protein n=1 Tax=Chitinimonas lacunae TaxID=1963018 RepID=A0ABV8MIR6_9NEIS